MIKYALSVVLAVALAVPAFAGNCHFQQAVVAQPVVTYVQPVRQQFVEVQHAQPVVQFVSNGHHANAQQVVVQRQRANVQVQRVVVANNHNVQAVRVQKVVVNTPRVQRSRVVVRR